MVSGSGDRTVTDVYTLTAVPRKGSVWAFMVEEVDSSIEQGAGEIAYDSTNPQADDPWPLVAQFAISSVPADVELGPSGRPERMLHADRWRRSAQTEVSRRDLHPQAAASVDALLDPAGLIKDLQRNLPGLPPDGEIWEREEVIAGIRVVRSETCERSRRAGQRHWECRGTLQVADEGEAVKLYESTSYTRISADAQGMTELDTLYDATMVYVDASTGTTRDKPIAGRRRVLRRNPLP